MGSETLCSRFWCNDCIPANESATCDFLIHPIDFILRFYCSSVKKKLFEKAAAGARTGEIARDWLQ